MSTDLKTLSFVQHGQYYSKTADDFVNDSDLSARAIQSWTKELLEFTTCSFHNWHATGTFFIYEHIVHRMGVKDGDDPVTITNLISITPLEAFRIQAGITTD
jgi:hypothetical protein